MINDHFAVCDEDFNEGYLDLPCLFKTIIIFNLGEKLQDIYLAALRLGKYSTTIHLDFKEKLLNIRFIQIIAQACLNSPR